MKSFRLRLAVVACACLAVAGCSSDDGETDVRRAQAKVDAAEKSLVAAREAATAAADQFCGDGADYLVAVNRYGGVLTTREATVGDVRVAGSELDEPAAGAADSADAAVAAREDVVVAERELIEAKATLAEAKSTTPTPTPDSTATKLVPVAPPASLTRVEQAQADLESAVDGISDETPLEQASEQLNAAAVAVEMSALRLLADVGCLTDEQQEQAEKAAHDYTTTLQQSLALVGYYTDAVDGVYGPATVEAVEELQEKHGLPVTGAMDRATTAALEDELAGVGGAAEAQSIATAAAVQQTLSLAGFWSGPIDGEWTPELTEALEDFQAELGVPTTGEVDAATLAALEQGLVDLRAEPEASETPDSSPSEAQPEESSSADATEAPNP